MIVVSIDPGVRRLGWAAWEGSVLRVAGLSRADEDHATLAQRASDHAGAVLQSIRGISLVALESMEAGGDRVPPQDLIDVEAVGCLTSAWLAPSVVLLPPSIWKSSVPKDVHHERNRGVLSQGERLILDSCLVGVPKTNRKEVLDAVGIGLYYLRRTCKAGGPRT